jgi:hypothetical protein
MGIRIRWMTFSILEFKKKKNQFNRVESSGAVFTRHKIPSGNKNSISE